MPGRRDPRESRDRGRGRGDDRGKDRGKGAWGRKQKPKGCQFCKESATWVDYKDTQLLRKFVSDRGKIRARRVTGTCAQHQGDVASAVKVAREMGLMPYTAR